MISRYQGPDWGPQAGFWVGALGEKFRQERERRGFSLDDVSNVTKISPRMLQAIEEEHFDQLPGGVFNKGFVRAYAKHLGLNDEEAVSEYLESLRQAQVDAENAAWQPRRPADVRSAGFKPGILATADPKPSVLPAQIASVNNIAPKVASPQIAQREIEKEKLAQADRPQFKAVKPKSGPRKPFPKKIIQNRIAAPAKVDDGELPGLQLPIAEDARPNSYLQTDLIPKAWRVPGIAAIVVVLVIIFWIRHSHSAQAEGGNSSHTNSAAANTPASPTGAPSAATVMAPQPAADKNSQPAPSGHSSVSTSASTSASTNAANPSSAKGNSSAGSNSVNKSQTTKNGASAGVKAGAKDDANDDADDEVISRTIPAKPEKTKPLPTFTVVIRATENSRISVMADGQTVREETLIAPAYTSVKATRDVVVKAANAGAVSFLFNGKEIQTEAQEGQAKTFQFDSNGLKTGAEMQLPRSQP